MTINGRVEAIEANIVDLHQSTVNFGRITWQDGVICTVEMLDTEREREPYLTPGLVDAHVHIESSMLTPAEFGRQAVRHGTLATVSDPHEIANVLGVEGIRYMLKSAAQSPCRIFLLYPPVYQLHLLKVPGQVWGRMRW